ncbi:MAG: hypothetical protein PHO23_02135 [Candidatus Pacebacteria bacterium]|nr:hypothetical protein [Candidatus Paceibacterota bacterium]
MFNFLGIIFILIGLFGILYIFFRQDNKSTLKINQKTFDQAFSKLEKFEQGISNGFEKLLRRFKVILLKMENSISGSLDGIKNKQSDVKKDFVKNLEEIKDELEGEISKEEKLINNLFEKKGIDEYYDLFKLYIEYKSLKDAREVLLKSISFMPKEKTEEMIKEIINLEEILK